MPKVILKTIILLSVAFKLLLILFFVNLNDLDFYEYGELAQNLHSEKSYSFVHYTYDPQRGLVPSDRAHKSAYMPPGYVLYLYPFYFFTSIPLRNFLIIFSQIIFSSILILLVYRFTKAYFSETSALIASAITGFLPEFIFTSIHIQVTLFFHIGIVALFLQLYKLSENKSFLKNSIRIGIILGMLIIFRSEIFLLFILLVCYLFYVGAYKQSLIIIGIIILFILPWQIRNYAVFNKIIPFTTSAGLNLYRGHNPYNIGNWGDDNIYAQLYSIRNDSDYEIKMNDLYMQETFKSIVENPENEIVYPLIKFYHLWIVNPNEERTSNLFYLIPWIIILTFSIIGLIISASWKTHKYSYLFFIYFILVVVIFFALPRYQTMMKIALVPFAAYASEILYSKVKAMTKKTH